MAGVAALVGVPLCTSLAAAEENRGEQSWYGWQTLMLDATAIASGTAAGVIFASGPKGENIAVPMLVLVTVPTFFFGPPVVHWAHGHAGTGFASLGIRFGGLFLMSAASQEWFNWGPVSFWSGAAVLAGAVVLDAAVFAYEPRPIADRSTAAFAGAWRLNPWTSANSFGLELTVYR